MSKPLGFIGLGAMGMPIARKLLESGRQLVVHNRSRGKVDEMVAAGAIAAASPAEVAIACDIVLTCVLSPDQDRDIYLGASSLRDAAEKRHVFVDCSTVDPGTTRELEAAIAATGAAYLDAPVSGGPLGAQKGTLAVMVGGDAAAYARVEPILRLYGGNVFHMGATGAGVTTKLCNQMLIISTGALIAESFVMGTKAGIDPTALYNVLRVSSGASFALERTVPRFFLTGDYTANATASLAVKDLDCVVETARGLGMEPRIAPVARAMYCDAVDAGFGDEDWTAVVKPVQQRAGVDVSAAAKKR